MPHQKRHELQMKFASVGGNFKYDGGARGLDSKWEMNFWKDGEVDAEFGDPLHGTTPDETWKPHEISAAEAAYKKEHGKDAKMPTCLSGACDSEGPKQKCSGKFCAAKIDHFPIYARAEIPEIQLLATKALQTSVHAEVRLITFGACGSQTSVHAEAINYLIFEDYPNCRSYCARRN
jgi:hypothetical protein